MVCPPERVRQGLPWCASSSYPAASPVCFLMSPVRVIAHHEAGSSRLPGVEHLPDGMDFDYEGRGYGEPILVSPSLVRTDPYIGRVLGYKKV